MDNFTLNLLIKFNIETAKAPEPIAGSQIFTLKSKLSKKLEYFSKLLLDIRTFSFKTKSVIVLESIFFADSFSKYKIKLSVHILFTTFFGV